MRKDSDHLQPLLQRQLERAVAVLREEFAEAIKGKEWERKKQGRILKIILYGSMARGTQVTDMRSGYRSDFDLLVVVSDAALADDDWWYGANDALNRLWLKSSNRREVNFIVHDLADVNDQLRRGRPFFKDIDRDGIIVYEYDPKPLARPGNLSPEEIHAEALGHFEQWFESSLDYLKLAKFSMAENMPNKAAFLLHQAVESAYHCALLTLTLYSPQLHRIDKLRQMAEGVDQRLVEAWPRKTRFDRRPFNKIRRAYIEARYSKHYRITKELLEEAKASVETLQGIVKVVCGERLTTS